MKLREIRYSEEHLMKVLITPVISEKATFVLEQNKQVIFIVHKSTTKFEIQKALELLFKVQVKSINILNRLGKQKRSGRFVGFRRHEKRAYVNLKPGYEIRFDEGVL